MMLLPWRRMGKSKMEYAAIYRMGAERLQQAGIKEALLDARLLLEAACGTDQNTLLAHGNQTVTEQQKECYVNYIEQRSHHVPLQHITGYQEFMGLRFQVSPAVLIPRQDTETLVEEVMRFLHDGMRILDLCTGSGCILLSLLRYSNDCVGVGSDLSEDALQVAKENASLLGLEAEFVCSDLFEKIEGKYEIIVSNPPYIRSGDIPGLMEEVRDHDPMIALDGGEDGLSFYRKIIVSAGDYLYPGGMLFFEIGSDQAQEAAGYMNKAGYRDIAICKDLAGLDRVVYGRFVG